MARVNSSRPNSHSPFSLGYWMHAECAPHKATWLAWPRENTDWPGKFGPIPWVYGDVVRRLPQAERVCILVNDSAAERAARDVLKPCGANLKAVDFFRVPTNRGWIRDFRPIFVKNGDGDAAPTNWHFNAWAKYKNWQKDYAANDKLAVKLKRKVWKPDRPGPPRVPEGRSMSVHGARAIATT